MTELILLNDQGLTHVLNDVEATIDWESGDGFFQWSASPLTPRPGYGKKTVVAASTRSPMTTLTADASEAERLEALGFGEDMKLVRRGKEIDRADVRKGDRIRIEWTYDDGTTLAREETARYNGPTPYASQSDVEQKVYLLERAPFELPTTPGSVVRVETDEDMEGAADYVLGLDRIWRGGENGSKFHEDYFEDRFDGDPQILVSGEGL